MDAKTAPQGVTIARDFTLKALLRKTAARTIDDLWKAIGDAIPLFTPQECANYFTAAGYEPD